MNEGLVEGFVPDLGGSDPLERLAQLVGSQDDVDASQERGAVQNEDVQMEAAAEEEPGAAATDPAPVSLMSAIEEFYKLSCAVKRIEALKSHLDLLKNIPVSLMKQVNMKQAPSGVVGGAVIDVAAATDENEENNPPSSDHVVALLEAVTQSNTEGKLLLLDHLDLSGLPLPHSLVSTVVHQAATLGPWWRLRSLALSGCNIDITHLQQLMAPEAQSFLWHLERLDLSYNPCLGRDVAHGTLRPLTEFTAPSTLMMMRLWRGAPLKYLDLSYCELSSSVLAVCLRTLRSYPLPSSAGGCGAPLHDGTRPSLQCLKLGPPGDGVWTDGLVAEIAALMEAAPQLSVVELCGAVHSEERDALATAWQAVQEKRNTSNTAIQVAEVRSGVVRFAAGTATQQLLPIEHPPTQHSLPGPETPLPAAENAQRTTNTTNNNVLGDAPHFLDDWNNVYGTDCGNEEQQQPRRMVQDVLRPSVPRGSLLPPRRPDGGNTTTGGGGGGGGGGGTRPRGDGAPRRQRGGGGGSNSNRRDRLPAHQTTAADYGMTSGGWDDNDDDDKPVRQPRGGTTSTNPRKKRSAGQDGPRPVRIYRGGNAEDELPAGGIDINSDDDGRPMDYSEEDSYYSDDEGGDMMDVDTTNGPGGRYYDDEEEEEEEERPRQGEGMRRQSGPATAAAATAQGLASNGLAPPIEQTIEQRFKIRDGEMDVDSKLGRIYRADAKTFFKSIPDKADQKAAKAAFNLWDSCAENAWDRHRWDRPSKTQNDEPHVLGQLNKLFDLARKYNHDLGFPFPKWVPGGGTEAFTVVRRAAPSMPSVAAATVVQQPPKPPKTKVKAQGASRVPLPPRNRMVDDGGRGKESDKEESDGDGEDFMVPNGPVSDSESESDSEKEEEEKEVEVIDLVGSGKPKNKFMLPESQSPVKHQHTTPHHNRALIASDSEDSDEEHAAAAAAAAANNHNTTTSGGKDVSSAAAREIARLSAWNWDSRKEEHPPNEAVYGLADGKRSRRQRFTASQIVGVLGGSEEQQQQQQQQQLRKPRRRSELPQDGGGESEDDEVEPIADYSSSSDDDVPLAAQFSRFRTTPGSNEPGTNMAQKRDDVPVGEAIPTAVAANAEPEVVNKIATGVNTAILEQDAITPGAATGAVLVAPAPSPPVPPTEPSSAERAAALARALLGTLYKPNDAQEEHQEDMILPSLPVVTREEGEHNTAAAAAAAVSAPVPGGLLGIVPDSQEDEDINIF